LLVVIAIIVVLMSILLAAIQRVREHSKVMLCGNRLRQVALAALHYESDFGRLPPGYIGPKRNNSMDTSTTSGDPEDNQWVGHLPLLLPYLEQNDLAQQIQVNLNPDGQSPPWWQPDPSSPNPVPADYFVAAHSLTVLQCPSDPSLVTPFQPGGKFGTVVGLHIYHNGPFYNLRRYIENYDDGTGAAYPFVLGTTNYVGVAGSGKGTSPWWGQWEGAYTNRSATRLVDIVDGKTQTLLYGEIAGRNDFDAVDLTIASSLNVSWFGVGALPSGKGLKRALEANWDQFSSHHARGVQFAFADGSLRTVGYNIDAAVILQLSGIRDGTKPPEIE
jgi:hypothetical protein